MFCTFNRLLLTFSCWSMCFFCFVMTLMFCGIVYRWFGLIIICCYCIRYFMDMMNSNDVIQLIEEDKEEYEIVMCVMLLLVEELDSIFDKKPCRTSILKGHDYVLEILHGHEDRCYDQFRMDPHVFILFCEELKSKGNLTNSRYVTVQEQVAIFLLIISHNERVRLVAERFQHSGHTISTYFHRVLKAVCRLGVHIIRPPDFHIVPPQIRHNPNYYPFFKVMYLLFLIICYTHHYVY